MDCITPGRSDCPHRCDKEASVTSDLRPCARHLHADVLVSLPGHSPCDPCAGDTVRETTAIATVGDRGRRAGHGHQPRETAVYLHTTTPDTGENR